MNVGGKESSRPRAWPMSSPQIGLSAAFIVQKTGWWGEGQAAGVGGDKGEEFAEGEAMLGAPSLPPFPSPGTGRSPGSH